jgi:hypothetical protein
MAAEKSLLAWVLKLFLIRGRLLQRYATQNRSFPAADETLLLDFVFALGPGNWVFDSLLGLGFFHGSLGFGSAFGASFAALLTLFVEQFLATEQFDEGVVGAVTLAPSGANDAEVAAVAIAKARTDNIKQFVNRCAGHEVSERLTTGSKISALAEGDHLLDLGTHGFGFRDRGLDSLFDDERSHQIPQQRAAVRSVTSQFPSGYFVTHG